MKGARKKLGQGEENLAADHLKRRGYVIRQRNYRICALTSVSSRNDTPKAMP